MIYNKCDDRNNQSGCYDPTTYNALRKIKKDECPCQSKLLSDYQYYQTSWNRLLNVLYSKRKEVKELYEYFYGEQSNQFSFYRIPKILFIDEAFKSISPEAKILYGILLDRMSLSQKNGWTDDCGRVYIIFTVEEIMSSLCCQNQKANKLMYELEKKCGLIERKRQGLGKPNLIYVKNFIDNSKTHIKKCENHTSGNVKNTNQEMLKSHTNNTDINNTDFSDTDNPFLSETDERLSYRDIIKENIDYDILIKNYPFETDTIDEMLELILDTVCSKRQYIRIAGDDKPHSVVKSQLLKITSEHISYCIDCLKESTSDVKNIRQYILATLYNAPLTISNYYGMKVRHDMATG